MKAGAAGGTLFSLSELPTPEKARPLAGLSDFVVEALPGALEAIRLGKRSPKTLCESAGDLRRIPPVQDVPEQQRSVACLDLMLLQHACDRVGAEFPEPLRAPAAQLCRSLGRIQTFLYEDCVLANPLTRDPRGFTGGEVGRTERDFLLTHTWIEEQLADINRRLQDVLNRVEGQGAGSAAQALLEHRSPLLAALQQVRALFLSMRRIRREHFRGFREYYLPSPRTGRPGPSGRFSARFFLLRVLVEGSAIGLLLPTFYREVLEMFDYFPRGDREELLSHVLPEYVPNNHISAESLRVLETFGGRRAPRFRCLREVALEPWARSIELPALVTAIRETIDTCTSVHLGLVQKYVVDQAAVEPGP